MRPVRSGEEKGAVYVDQIRWGRAVNPGINVLDQSSPLFGAVALPQLGSMNTVVTGEEKRTI